MDTVLQIFTDLGVNQSLLQQFVIVIALFLISKAIFFNKLQFVIETREEKTTKTEETAEKTFQKAVELQEKYQEKMNKAYEEAQSILSTSKEEIVKKETAIFKSKESEINDFIDESRKKTLAEINQQREQVLGTADSMAEELVKKLH